MDIITAEVLASYLRDEALASDADLQQVVDLTNELVTDHWATPVTPAPVRVRLLALTVAARAWAWDPKTAHLESITRSVDDASRTERYRSSSSSGSVHLTDAELNLLRGSAGVRSIRLVRPGDVT